ncbi:hypothetical protein [Streptomyces sp. NPDC037389]|uniref:hypothetical protein n=1 Tax=Streptomyces sp. NPDC037389 TaxID=3155369 RepID=UPI0033D961BA
MRLIRRLLVMFAATSVFCLSGAGMAAAAPLPGVDALLAQVKSLGDLGGVLTPVTDVLDAALRAGG